MRVEADDMPYVLALIFMSGVLLGAAALWWALPYLPYAR
jgi:hypothetical protein